MGTTGDFLSVSVDSIIDLIWSHRFSFTSERELQDGIESIFIAAGLAAEVDFHREYELSPASRIDFYFPAGRIGLEVKTKGSPSDVARQIVRYAEFDSVSALIVVTSRRASAALPPIVSGKPVRVVALWESFLS